MMPRLRCLFFLCGFTGFAIHQARAQAAYDKIGQASWYGVEEAGRRTSSGIPFDPSRLSAAHRSLPLGSCVRVTQLGNHKSVVVPVIDRGPFVRGRLLDLSQAAAERLDMIKAGLAKVRIVLTSCTNGALPKATL
ncbi:MAG: septal ring lytic transglycosylase RlpA family protein [Puia sp.]|nr:septal ring lytic transglycosylase RlpA family protein [Puia sp.]